MRNTLHAADRGSERERERIRKIGRHKMQIGISTS